MSYAALVQHQLHLHRLRHVEAIASWDESTMMPTGSGTARGEALAALRGVIHEHATRSELVDLFGAAAGEAANLEPWQRANLREMEREWLRETALSPDLVEAMSRAESCSLQAWQALRPANDFIGYLPFFREVVRLRREAAQAWGDRLSLSPYDALLDGLNPGLRMTQIAPLFARLKAFLPGLMEKAIERQAREPVVTCEGPFPEERQLWLAMELARRLGFDFDRGRLDTSYHPFTCGVPEDVRITISFDTHDIANLVGSVMHELGHAKYQQNLPRDWLGQPVGEARSVIIHESQSLLLEMHLSRSRAFLEFAAPIIARAFPALVESMPKAFTPEGLLRHMTRVRRGPIRVHADEVTYPCHISLRFELEAGLINGFLQPEDLPEAWDAGVLAMLGLSTRGNDRDGCMQDMHWPVGLFGSFPSYTLGALTAAQLLSAVRRTHPDLDEHIRRGDFVVLDCWLRQHVWSQGSFLETAALVEHATGSPLSTVAFEQHLESRYLQPEY